MVCSTFWRFWKRDKNSDELLRENASDSNFNFSFFFAAPFHHRRILINRLNSRKRDRKTGVWYAYHHTHTWALTSFGSSKLLGLLQKLLTGHLENC